MEEIINYEDYQTNTKDYETLFGFCKKHGWLLSETILKKLISFERSILENDKVYTFFWNNEEKYIPCISRVSKLFCNYEAQYRNINYVYLNCKNINLDKVSETILETINSGKKSIILFDSIYVAWKISNIRHYLKRIISQGYIEKYEKKYYINNISMILVDEPFFDVYSGVNFRVIKVEDMTPEQKIKLLDLNPEHHLKRIFKLYPEFTIDKAKCYLKDINGTDEIDYDYISQYINIDIYKSKLIKKNEFKFNSEIFGTLLPCCFLILFFFISLMKMLVSLRKLG